MRGFIVCIMLMCISSAALAQHDTVFFSNGTIVIGEIKKINLGVLLFDPDDANDITVQLRKIHSLSSPRYYRIETVDHQLIFGKLTPGNQPGFANIVFGSDTIVVSLNNISNLYPIEKNFKKRLSGFISAGYSYTRSSELGRLNLDGSAKYTTKKMEYMLNASAISTIDKGVFSRDNENAGLTVNYYFDKKWFAGGLLNYQRNIELGISSRFQEGGGFGNKLLLTKYVRLLAFAGIVLNQETSIEDIHSGVLTESMLGFQFNVFRFEKPEIDIQTTEYGFFSLSQDRIRYDGDISINWEMVEDLDLKISFYSNYDSKPPGETTANIDYGTVISIAYEF